MNKEFLEKWKSDKKYRTKIKLIAYTAFVVIVSVYALALNNNTPTNTSILDNTETNNEIVTNKINIPDDYNYKITINIDDQIYTYSGQKTIGEETITKDSNGVVTNYRYSNNEYYALVDDVYQLTTKKDVYDVVKYNYINLESINTYLSKAYQNNNEYWVYLKDVILGNESNDNFIITLNDNFINIDYTPLVREFDHNIQKYLVNIEINKN